MNITNEQWKRLVLLLSATSEGQEDKTGDTQWTSRSPERDSLDLVGRQDLPTRYPINGAKRACPPWPTHSRECEKLDSQEVFIDKTLAPAKKGGVPLVKSSAVKTPGPRQRLNSDS